MYTHSLKAAQAARSLASVALPESAGVIFLNHIFDSAAVTADFGFASFDE